MKEVAGWKWCAQWYEEWDCAILVCFIFTGLLLNRSFPGSRRTEGGMECGWVESQVFLLVQITADAIFGGLFVYILKTYSESLSKCFWRCQEGKQIF